MHFKSIWATAIRNYQIQLRAYPKDFFIGNVLTCFFLVLGTFFIYKTMFNAKVSHDFAHYAGTGDYMSFVILGSIIYMFVVRTFLNVSRSFITEMREGTLDSLLVAPVNHMGYLCGNMLEQTITTTGEAAIALLICLPFGLNLTSINLLSTLICMLASLFAFFSMSIILGAFMLYSRDTYICQNTVFALLNLICGTMFPVQYLPGWVQNISYSIPVTYSLKILRNSVLNGMDITSQLQDFSMLLVLSVFYGAIGVLLIRKVIKTAPENQFM